MKPAPEKGKIPQNPHGVTVVLLLLLFLLAGPYGYNTYKPSSEVADPPASVGDAVTSFWGGVPQPKIDLEPQF